jgi:hypothetical protein
MKQSIVLKLFIVLVGVAAVGGAAFVGFRHANEVRGESGAVQAPATRATTVVPTRADASEAAHFLLQLRPEDVTQYTDPAYGFTFSYPRAFERSTSTADGTALVYVAHPTLPLAITIEVSPLVKQVPQVEELKALSADYDQEAPEGVDSNVQAWIDERAVPGAAHRGQMWFARQGFLYQVVLEAPDTDLLESWMHEFLYDNLSFFPR